MSHAVIEPPTVHTETEEKFSIYRYAARALNGVMEFISVSRKTGSLTIHFSQGRPSGMLEWKQRSD